MSNEREVIERLARIEAHVEFTAGQVTQVRDSLFGNGKPGIVTRLDRLEQIERRRSWTVRALIAAVLAALAGTFGIR